MKQTIKTSRVAGQLEKMFRALNNRFFDGELPEVVIIAIFKNKANSRRNGTSLSSQKAKLSEKHIVSRSEEHPASSP